MSSLALIINHHMPAKFDSTAAKEIGTVAAAMPQRHLRAMKAPIAKNVVNSAAMAQASRTIRRSGHRTSAIGPTKAQTIATTIQRRGTKPLLEASTGALVEP